MHPVQAVVPAVLADVIRRQPSSLARTSFAWSVAVGPALSRVTSVELCDGILRVSSKDGRWAREIDRARATILERIRALLGRDVVADLLLVD